jgi:hypothetical protein
MKKLNELIVSINELVETIFENPLGKIFGVILFFTILLASLHYSDKSNAEDFVWNEQYYGCITEKQLFNKKGADFYFLDIRTKKIERLVYGIFSTKYQGLYEYAQVGDTIIKIKGKGRITIKKTNGEVRDFEYNSRILPDVE